MQSCDYCGRESENSTAYCVECGSSFIQHEPPRESLSAVLRRDVVAVGSVVRRYEIRFRRAICLTIGVCWILFALVFGLFLVAYVAEGAGLQFFRVAVSSATVLIGLVHISGLAVAACMSFAFGVVMLAQGLLPTESESLQGR